MTGRVIDIGGRRVGAEHSPFVIAEMSGNHNGSLDQALEIVRAAAGAGADAIKLQTFTAATLTLDSHRREFFIDDPGGPWHGRRLWELYEEAHTPWDWHEPIFEAAREAGLICISSAFDDSSLEFLLRLGVDAIKIASFECVHLPLIEAAAGSGKPVIISAGMATLEEIEDAVSALRRGGSEDFVLLKCTSAYPAEERDANVLTMHDMGERFDCSVGLSDHSLRPFAAYAAVALGAAVLEKHLTIRRADGGVDSEFSLEPPELRELVEGARLVWQSRGQVAYHARSAEAASLRERPSIYVSREIGRGEAFTKENMRVVRPAGGLAPKYYHEVLGKIAVRDLAAATPVRWDMIDLRKR